MTTARKLVNVLTTPASKPLDGAAEEAYRLLRSKRNVVLYGAPGTGKTFAALAVRRQWESDNGIGSVHLVTFHPSYAYEDFVQGWRPDLSGSGDFVLADGVLLEAIKNAVARAQLIPVADVLIVIDEINRADVARTFGELITFLEWDKRGLPFSTAQDRSGTMTIPPNLYVLGTMNTADKSVSLLDAAMRRRFAFVNVAPDPGAFKANSWVTDAHGVSLSDLLESINHRLAGQNVELDRQLGQALLAVKPGPDSDQELLDRLRYDVLPLVEDYLYGDVSRILEVLPGLIGADGHHTPIQVADLDKVLAGLIGVAIVKSSVTPSVPTLGGSGSTGSASISSPLDRPVGSEDGDIEPAEEQGNDSSVGDSGDDT